MGIERAWQAPSSGPVAIAAANAGIHVLVEKPTCLNLDEGHQMLEAAAAAGVQLMVGTMKRYDPAYERLLEVLRQAGELRLVRVTTLESPWRPHVENYTLASPAQAPAHLIERLTDEDAQRLAAGAPRRGREHPLLLPLDAARQPRP